MKLKRQKRAKKVLMFYKHHFGFDPPYNVLVDGTFCNTALEWKVNIREQLPKYLEAETKLFTTKCAIAECKSFGTLLYGPLKILEGYIIMPCKHDTPIQATKCLYNSARLKEQTTKFFIATNDPALSEKVRNTRGLPLLCLSHRVISLQAPSQVSKEQAATMQHARLAAPTQTQAHVLSTLTKQHLAEGTPQSLKRKRNGSKGPNPLSCKRKKVSKEKIKSTNNSSENNGEKKRTRKRHKRITSHR